MVLVLVQERIPHLRPVPELHVKLTLSHARKSLGGHDRKNTTGRQRGRLMDLPLRFGLLPGKAEYIKYTSSLAGLTSYNPDYPTNSLPRRIPPVAPTKTNQPRPPTTPSTPSQHTGSSPYRLTPTLYATPPDSQPHSPQISIAKRRKTATGTTPTRATTARSRAPSAKPISRTL